MYVYIAAFFSLSLSLFLSFSVSPSPSLPLPPFLSSSSRLLAHVFEQIDAVNCLCYYNKTFS